MTPDEADPTKTYSLSAAMQRPRVLPGNHHCVPISCSNAPLEKFAAKIEDKNVGSRNLKPFKPSAVLAGVWCIDSRRSPSDERPFRVSGAGGAFGTGNQRQCGNEEHPSHGVHPARQVPSIASMRRRVHSWKSAVRPEKDEVPERSQADQSAWCNPKTSPAWSGQSVPGESVAPGQEITASIVLAWGGRRVASS